MQIIRKVYDTEIHRYVKALDFLGFTSITSIVSLDENGTPHYCIVAESPLWNISMGGKETIGFSAFDAESVDSDVRSEEE